MSRSINRQCPLCGMRHSGPPNSYHLTEDDLTSPEPATTPVASPTEALGAIYAALHAEWDKQCEVIEAVAELADDPTRTFVPVHELRAVLGRRGTR